MPNHIHALVWLPLDYPLRRFMHGWKRMSSLLCRRWYADHAPNYFREFGPGRRFWQPKFDAFQVHTNRKLQQKLDYMHLNPVRARLVERAVDWAWSSARWYILTRSVGVPIEGFECE